MKLTEQHREVKLQHAADRKTAGHLEIQQKLLRAPETKNSSELQRPKTPQTSRDQKLFRAPVGPDWLRSDRVNLLQTCRDSQTPESCRADHPRSPQTVDPASSVHQTTTTQDHTSRLTFKIKLGVFCAKMLKSGYNLKEDKCKNPE